MQKIFCSGKPAICGFGSGASLLCPSDGRGKGEREREEKREGG